ncbi:jacalin-like lectin [Azospirillum argentinense]
MHVSRRAVIINAGIGTGVAAVCSVIGTPLLAQGAGNWPSSRRSLGPEGGPNGVPYADGYPGRGNKIRRVSINHGTIIDGFQCFWETGSPGDHHGGSGGSPYDFDIDRGDYLTTIEGSVGPHNSWPTVVKSLKFHTKSGGSSPLYGAPRGAQEHGFLLKAPKGWQILGFFGRSGTVVDAIGVFCMPIPARRPTA